MGPALRILLALLGGVVLGAVLRASGSGWLPGLLAVADPVGGLWLNALRMGIVPLVFTLVITGIAAASDRAAAGGLAGRSLALMTGLLLGSSILAALLLPLFLDIWPIAEQAAAALRTLGTGSADLAAATQAPADWWRGIVPTNPIQAAADGA